jgi:hypothetical protein
MGFKRIDVRVTDSTLSTIKKRAVSEGKTVSEFLRELLASVLDHPSGSGYESGTKSPGEIDRNGIRETFSEAVMEAMQAGGSGMPPEALRYLVQDLAKTENLLRQISLSMATGKPKEHEERVRIAKQKSNRILKNLKLNEIEDVDRPEVTSKEEAEKMLREMGIIENTGVVKLEGEK